MRRKMNQEESYLWDLMYYQAEGNLWESALEAVLEGEPLSACEMAIFPRIRKGRSRNPAESKSAVMAKECVAMARAVLEDKVLGSRMEQIMGEMLEQWAGKDEVDVGMFFASQDGAADFLSFLTLFECASLGMKVHTDIVWALEGLYGAKRCARMEQAITEYFDAVGFEWGDEHGDEDGEESSEADSEWEYDEGYETAREDEDIIESAEKGTVDKRKGSVAKRRV